MCRGIPFRRGSGRAYGEVILLSGNSVAGACGAARHDAGQLARSLSSSVEARQQRYAAEGGKASHHDVIVLLDQDRWISRERCNQAIQITA